MGRPSLGRVLVMASATAWNVVFRLQRLHLPWARGLFRDRCLHTGHTGGAF